MRIKRTVDTVTMEVDVSTAEKLAEILSHTIDETYPVSTLSDLTELRDRLAHDGEVCVPSPLYSTENVIRVYYSV